MSKLLLLSNILAVLIFPIWAAKQQDPRKGIRKLLLSLVIYHTVYVWLALYVYPRIAG